MKKKSLVYDILFPKMKNKEKNQKRKENEEKKKKIIAKEDYCSNFFLLQ